VRTSHIEDLLSRSIRPFDQVDTVHFVSVQGLFWALHYPCIGPMGTVLEAVVGLRVVERRVAMSVKRWRGRRCQVAMGDGQPSRQTQETEEQE